MVGQNSDVNKGRNSVANLQKMTLYNPKVNLVKDYRVIALISANIVPSLDIEGRELASVRRYPNEGQYSPISV